MTESVRTNLQALEARLDEIRAAPEDLGTLELIVRRPAENEREILNQARLDVTSGLEGDGWSSSRPPGMSGPDPEAQLTVMNARAANVVAGARDRWALAGDQLYVDFDISQANLPPGARVRIGAEAVIEFSAKPHTGCEKFSGRFGLDALKFVSTTTGKQLRLRGANCRVVVSGLIQTGDVVRKLPEAAPGSRR